MLKTWNPCTIINEIWVILCFWSIAGWFNLQETYEVPCLRDAEIFPLLRSQWEWPCKDGSATHVEWLFPPLSDYRAVCSGVCLSNLIKWCHSSDKYHVLEWIGFHRRLWRDQDLRNLMQGTDSVRVTETITSEIRFGSEDKEWIGLRKTENKWAWERLFLSYNQQVKWGRRKKFNCK